MIKGGMQQLMKQAQQMQKKMEKLQGKLEELKVEASVGGGMVSVIVNGQKKVVALHIDREVVDPEDVEMLQDLIVAAVNEGIRKAEEKHQEEMGKIVPANMMGGLPGLF